ncbi:Release factor glutamine methyltransferase [Kingella potus]|uniref:Release factor glutamine methyltransferase n=1 Tax=Kingella potus TaxID=265175 RepID=A0A377R0G3_9NEIS|nr:peptide chain release factor N(5)-glutamine methyltransferase [Kingella potus]STR00579.1 Release factor glutamine methyltransferase [Kingella potus]
MTIENYLRRSPLPKNEARLLAQAATGLTHAELITRSRDPLQPDTAAALAALEARRLAGEPVAYILGSREFYGRRFAVSPAVLIPRPETEHLVEAALAHLPAHGSVWDIGTGSGAIAVTLACERPSAQVYASDTSPAALDTARENAAACRARVRFACGSWFDAFPPSECAAFDLIVSNPPYIEAGDPHLQQGDLRFEPPAALTDFSDGLSCIRILAQGAARRLAGGGHLIVEHGCGQGEAARAIFAAAGWRNIRTLPDLAGLDRITLGQKAV